MRTWIGKKLRMLGAGHLIDSLRRKRPARVNKLQSPKLVEVVDTEGSQQHNGKETREQLPKLSIILPVYNVAEYLEDCLNSIRTQEYENVEIVIVDDGSTDSSLAICLANAAEDNRIIVYSLPHSGNGVARNFGVTKATGEFLTFVDADDMVMPKAYSVMVETIVKTKSDFVCGAYRRLVGDKHVETAAVRRSNSVTVLSTDAQKNPEVIYNPFLWCKVFRTSFWFEAKIEFPIGTNYEDQLPTLKAFAKAHSFDLIDDVVYLWRARHDRSSLTQRKRELSDLKERIAVTKSMINVASSVPGLRAHWVRKLASDDYYYFIKEVPNAGDEFFGELSSILRWVLAEIEEVGWEDVLFFKRALVEVCVKGTKSQLEEVLCNLDTYGTFPSIEEVERELVASHSLETNLSSDLSKGVKRVLPVDIQDQVRAAIVSPFRIEDERCVFDTAIFVPGINTNIPIDVDVTLVSRSNKKVTPLFITPTEPKISRYCRVDSWGNSRVEFFTVGQKITEFDELHDWHDIEVSVTIHDFTSVIKLDAGEMQTNLSAIAISDDRKLVCCVTDALAIKTLPVSALITSIEYFDENLCIKVELQKPLPEPFILRMYASSKSKTSSVDGVRLNRPGEATNALFFYIQEQDFLDGTYDLKLLCGENISLPLSVARHVVEEHRAYLIKVLELTRSGWGVAGLRVKRNSVRFLGLEFGPSETSLLFRGLSQFSGKVTPGLALTRKGFDAVYADRVRRIGADAVSWTAEFDLGELGRSSESVLPYGRWVLRWEPDPQSNPDPSRWRYVEYCGVDDMDPTVGKRYSVRAAKTKTGQTEVHASAPFMENERGAVAQRKMQSAAFGHRQRKLQDQIYLDCFSGKSFGDSIRPLASCLLDLEPTIQLIAGVQSPSVVVPQGVQAVQVYSQEWYDKLSRSRIIVGNNNLPHFFRKGREQLYFQLWHGTPLKRLMYDMPISSRHPSYFNLMQREIPEWDALLAGNNYSKQIFRGAFEYKGPIDVWGYPRNDVLVRQPAGLREQVRESLGILPESRCYLYMPTWRDDSRGQDGRVRPISYLDTTLLTDVLGNEDTILVRGHHVSKGPLINSKVKNGTVIDVTAYPDVSLLFLAADVLITDYSSAMFDFSLLEKPIVFLTPDIETYQDQIRGFYFDFIDEAPGPIVQSTKEFIDVLPIVNSSEYWAEYTMKHLYWKEKFLSVEDGRSSERMARRILNEI